MILFWAGSWLCVCFYMITQNIHCFFSRLSHQWDQIGGSFHISRFFVIILVVIVIVRFSCINLCTIACLCWVVGLFRIV